MKQRRRRRVERERQAAKRTARRATEAPTRLEESLEPDPGPWFCPRDGSELRPSHAVPTLWHRECPTCGALVVLPDLTDPEDLGVLLRAVWEWDDDPRRTERMLASRKKDRAHAMWSHRPPLPDKFWPEDLDAAG